MARNGSSVYGAPRCKVGRSNYANFTQQGNTLFVHVRFWPGETVVVGGMKTKVLSAKLLATGKPVTVEQDEFRVRLTGLPAHAPDDPVTTIALDCAGEPEQDTNWVRTDRPRAAVGVGTA
jgi:alpha-L-fucosidase